MTREEAIRIIKIVLVVAENFEITVQGEKFTEEKCKEAVDMAIKALKQEPCGDAISRQAAIYVINHAEVNFSVESEIDFTKHKREVHEIIENVLGAQEKALKELPPVTAEKVGRWEWNQYDSNQKIGNFHCSQCHGIGKAYYDYCPYCGSRMTQEVEK